MRGMLLRIAIPRGKPIMVIFNNQAAVMQRTPSHQPINMNHRAWIKQPGPAALWIVVCGCDWVSIVIIPPYLLSKYLTDTTMEMFRITEFSILYRSVFLFIVISFEPGIQSLDPVPTRNQGSHDQGLGIQEGGASGEILGNANLDQ